MTRRADPISFAGSTLRTYRHVCAFFNSEDEEYATLLPFIVEGLKRGERAYHVLQSRHRDEHVRRLRGGGVDVDNALQKRQLEVVGPQDTYLRGGRFNQTAMLELVQQALRAGGESGFPLTRMVAHAEVVLEDSRSANDWIEYESRLNQVLPGYDDAVICTYDANLLSGPIAIDILRTHPVAIVGGVLHENPFFLPPEQFLREIASRSSAPLQAYR
jgi:hypothetical protein